MSPFSLSEISTVGASFEEDVRAYAAAGFEGIGIWEMKLDDDQAHIATLRESGLRVTNCVPNVPSILPNAVIDGPEDVEVRVASMCASLHRLAAYGPDSVLCLTGARDARHESEARAIVIDGLRRLAATADGAGVRLGLEPIHASQREQLTLVTTIPETLELLAEAGLPDVGIMVDLWHLWDSPEIDRHLRENLDRITGVHVADWFADARPERALPGEGIARIGELLDVLRDAGWGGAFDVEIFGVPDDPGSFWALDVDDAARRAHAAIESVAG
jgi:sugar phosphate isomerase/epimerase